MIFRNLLKITRRPLSSLTDLGAGSGLFVVVVVLCLRGGGGEAPLGDERQDGLRHVGHEVGVLVLQHSGPVEVWWWLLGPTSSH